MNDIIEFVTYLWTICVSINALVFLIYLNRYVKFAEDFVRKQNKNKNIRIDPREFAVILLIAALVFGPITTSVFVLNFIDHGSIFLKEKDE